MTTASSAADPAPVPALGLGTWQNTDPAQCRETVKTALEMGYRHVDTAQMYGNETAVGEGIAAADVPREDVFLATKVWFDSLSPTVLEDAVELSLARLDLELDGADRDRIADLDRCRRFGDPSFGADW